MREEPTRGRGGVLRGCPDDRPALGTVLEKFLSQFPLGVCRGHRMPQTGGSWVCVSQLRSLDARGQGTREVGLGDAPARLWVAAASLQPHPAGDRRKAALSPHGGTRAPHAPS